ncbi:MAG: DNA-directed RNA polymerase subunit alpha [Candidatus Ratteibacteria bacterium]|jgi:DNA-directed RNA polymerase subunit alpha
MKEFIFPKKVVWEKETYRDNYGKIVIEPLERGYGVTLGNALRRILLSSIEGIAITAVKIQGAPSEFTTIKGVQEDVVEIVMNVKQVALKPIISDFPHLTSEKEIKGKEEICAGDLIDDGSVEVLNKDLNIATLMQGKSIKLQVEINKGRGYIPNEKMKLIRPASPIGTILIDGFFSPVRKVSFSVDNTRVGQFVDYEKLILEIWTTGAITPYDALKEATALMNRHFSIVGEEQKIGEELKEAVLTPEKETAIDKSKPISELKFDTRISRGLDSAGIETLDDLLNTPKEELEKVRNLGKKSIEKLESVLDGMGLTLKTKEELEKEEAEK